MNKRYTLSQAEHNHILESKIKPVVFKTAKAVKNPKITLIVGQPACGKSTLIEQTKNEYGNKNFAVINGDDFRSYHPKESEIGMLYDKDYAKYTDPDTREWTRKLLNEAVENRYNIIFESTFRNPEPIMTTIKEIAKKGYSIHIKAMAVKSEYTLLGIEKRYETQKYLKGYGRYTDKSIHDDAYNNFPNTLDMFEKTSIIDGISVYTREKQIYENNFTNKADREVGAKSIIISEHNRELRMDEIDHLISEWDNIKKIKIDNALKADKQPDLKATNGNMINLANKKNKLIDVKKKTKKLDRSKSGGWEL